ncbi:MAG TPA: YhgE/Pip family protein [Amnibacterium sp.]|nr:YhgE/Pip family protein [Amnibacterium sp.]
MNRSFRSIALLVVAAVVPALVLGVFVGALASADKGHATVPAAVVNQDRFVQTKGADGRTTTIAAGRLVVTNLTKPASATAGAAIDWRLSNAKQAQALLDAGDVYAIVTIPQGFSKSISSVSSTDPTRARITIRTDDAHGYVVSQLASSLGTSLTATLGSTIAEGVITGLYGGYGTLHGRLGSAATGARSLGTGADSLASGLGRLASGQDGIASGATGLGSGAARLAAGADSLAGGLQQAASGAHSAASGLTTLQGGVRGYVGGVTGGLSTAASKAKGLQQLPAGFASYAAGVGSAGDSLQRVIDGDPTLTPQTKAALQQIRAGLGTAATGTGEQRLAAGISGAASFQSAIAALGRSSSPFATGGAKLVSGVGSAASGVGALANGLDSSASGASSLATGARGIASGADQLGGGAAKIASGIRSSETGASKLGTGATSIGTGLQKAVDALPDTTPAQAAKIANVVANPVQATAVRQHETTSIGQIVAALILPVSLWIGASAAVLLFGAIRRRLLATGIGSGRLVGAALARGAMLAIGQAALLIALLQATLALPWDRAALALLVAVVTGVAFFAVHQLLTALFGRAGTVISIVLLGAQLVAVGGLYPIQLVSAPFQIVSPYLPLTAAVGAMQAVITGASGATIAGGVATLAVTVLVAVGLTVAVVARRRSSVALFAPPAVPALG